MIKKKPTVLKTIFISSLVSFVFLFGCKKSLDPNRYENMRSPEMDHVENLEIAVEKPPWENDFLFPCSQCHVDLELNPERRLIEMHEEIQESFDHDSDNRWCLDCHDLESRDSLRLASGELLGFDESYKLCGQCHGDKLRDWKVGVHGKRTGYWNGRKKYLLCAHCHDPHSPSFNKLVPEPPPERPGSDTTVVKNEEKEH